MECSISTEIAWINQEVDLVSQFQKKIVESLGGKISVTSEEGRWTTFRFTIKVTEHKIERVEESKQYQAREEEVFVLMNYYFIISFLCFL